MMCTAFALKSVPKSRLYGCNAGKTAALSHCSHDSTGTQNHSRTGRTTYIPASRQLLSTHVPQTLIAARVDEVAFRNFLDAKFRITRRESRLAPLVASLGI